VGGFKAATWENISTIKDQFLEFNLGDKVVPIAEGILGREVMRGDEKCVKKWTLSLTQPYKFGL